MKLLNIKKQTNNKFLNMYELELRNKKGDKKTYFVASRRDQEDLCCVTKDHAKADGVMIIPITKEGEVIVIKQYRPAIDDYIYELPAGLVDDGEEAIVSLKRELKEETGLDIVEIIPGLGRDKVYLSPGMTDESVNLVYCTCDGELSKDGLEEDEDLEPLLISKEEAKAILQSDSKIDIKCLMVLQSFININIDI